MDQGGKGAGGLSVQRPTEEQNRGCTGGQVLGASSGGACLYFHTVSPISFLHYCSVSPPGCPSCDLLCCLMRSSDLTSHSECSLGSSIPG